MDRRIGDLDQQPREILEDESLTLREFGTQECTEEVFVELDRRVENLLPVDRRITAKPIAVEVEHIEARRMLNIVGIDEHKTIRQARACRGTPILQPRDRANQIALAVDHDHRAAVLHRPYQIVIDEKLHQLRLSVPRPTDNMGVFKPCGEGNGKRQRTLKEGKKRRPLQIRLDEVLRRLPCIPAWQNDLHP